MADDRISTSRAGRAAKLGRVAAGQAVRQLGTRTANVARSDEKSHAALERRHLQAAEQIVTVLGTMKGASMKLGQMLSFLDVGLVPEESREEFQRKLGALRDAAPKVAFKSMRKVIEDDLGERISDVFDEFDEEPIAAASIGQVYRARLDDGRAVAVKVQYPGVAQAVRSDLQNLALILRLFKRMAPGLDANAVATEFAERITEELDYELEAQNQRRLARIFRDHPFIRVPDVITSLSRERVIVTGFVEGKRFERVEDEPQEVRDRVGEIVFRFFFGSMYRHHQFSGDPHPGNLILQDDGSVAFLDFGFFKSFDPEAAASELRFQRAVTEGDAEAAHAEMAARGFFPSDERAPSPEGVLAYARESMWWYTADEEVEIAPDMATRVMIEMSDPRSSNWREMRHQTVPPEHLIGRRLEILTLAIISQLGARANWHRIAREWMYGEAPVTELGRQEAEFYAGALR